MNAYIDRTFIIGSEDTFRLEYWSECDKRRDFSKFKSAKILFTNLINETTHTFENVLANGTDLTQGIVIVRYLASDFPAVDSKFFETNDVDSYGAGHSYHSYGLWLEVGNEKECILRGKALFVKGK